MSHFSNLVAEFNGLVSKKGSTAMLALLPNDSNSFTRILLYFFAIYNLVFICTA